MEPFPDFIVAYRSWLIVEEHVTVTLPGNWYTRPTLKVSDEERQRWPSQYAKFRKSLSVRAKFRLWLWRWVGHQDRPPHFDEVGTSSYNAFVNSAIQQRIRHDKTVETDIRAAIAKQQETK